MSKWIRLRCSCGATWRWYGRPEEAASLERLWRMSHKGHGHAVSAGPGDL